MEEEIPYFNIGYIKFNTDYRPKLFPEIQNNKTKWYYDKTKCDGRILNNGLYIKSSIPIELEIGGYNFILKEGEHYIPSLNVYHNIKLITKVEEYNSENVEIYHNCIFDDMKLISLLCRYKVNIDSFKYKKKSKL